MRALAADLELVHVVVEAVKSLEDRVVKVFKRLVTANLDSPRDGAILPYELACDRPLDDRHLELE